MTSNKSSGLKGTSRIDIFRNLAVDEITNMIDMELLSSISTTNYARFISFCDQVKEERKNIESVSCSLVNDELEFSINYK